MEQPDNNILMIAYLFPPLGGSGAIRPLKLAKYLPSFGWQPIILTVKNPDWYYAVDLDLQADLAPDIQIIRSFMIKSDWLYWVLNPLRIQKLDRILRRYLFHPDEQIGWILFGYFSALDIIRKFKIKAVYTTSGPLSCHLIGYLIKRKTGISWVADFRDEWIEAPYLKLPTELHRKLHYRLEELVVNSADKVIAMAPAFCELLSKHAPGNGKFATITGGFDPDDFAEQQFLENKKEKTKKFVISFIGLFYDSFRPNILIQALSELVAENKINPKELKLQFVGANHPQDLDIKDEFEITEFIGFVPRRRAIRYLINADALLLLLSEQRGKHVIPSKIYEYMFSGKPILALVPKESEVAKMITDTHSGIVADFDDFDGVKSACLRFYRNWKNDEKLDQPCRQKINQFNMKTICEKFARLLCGLT